MYSDNKRRGWGEKICGKNRLKTNRTAAAADCVYIRI